MMRDDYIPLRQSNPELSKYLSGFSIQNVYMVDEGIKHDQGKPKVGMVLQYFPLATLEVAKCGTYGTKKYGNGKFWDHNWEKVENGVERYSDAMLRHFLSEATEGTDKDTDLLHACHVAWNALARLELMLKKEKNKNV